MSQISGENHSILRTPRSHHSPISGTKSIVDSRVLGSASSQINKENLGSNENKSGIHNLSVERQKMKKGRKAGGYNLRKSLAWDRAFFTEEGVLDPVELSMITGISHGESLSVIDEEQRDSLTMNSDGAGGSANIGTLDEQKANTSSSLAERGSLSCSRHSKSSQRAPISQGVNKTPSKGGVCSSPMAPSAQKRLLNTGTEKVMTRNSKLPRVPLSKHSPLPSTTSIHGPSGGNHLNYAGTAQPAARKSLSLKLPSTINSASKGANMRSGATSKSIKQLGDNTRMYTTRSSSKMDSSANNKARTTNIAGNYLKNKSKQNVPIKMGESVDGIGRTRVSSHLSDNGDANRKDVQVQGVKPSGLRMPSPSMRFFSEANMKSSSLKASIPTSRNSESADHDTDFKQAKVRHGSLNHNAISKKRPSSQLTEICSTSSLVDPTTHAEAMYRKGSQQVVQQVLVRDKVPQSTNNVKCMKKALKSVDCQDNNEILTSIKDEEKDVNFDPIFQENACGNMMNSSIASYPEVHLTIVSETNGDVCQTLDEETGCSSSAINDEDLLSISHHNNSALVADCDTSTSMLYIDSIPGENKIGDLGQFNPTESLKFQLDGGKLLADVKCAQDMDKIDSATEVTINNNEVTRVVNNDSIGELPITKIDNIDLDREILVKDSYLERDRGESSVEISGGMHQMHSIREEVKSQSDLLSNPSRNDNNTACQTADLDARLHAIHSNDEPTSCAPDPVLEASGSPNISHDLPSKEVLQCEALDFQTDKPDDSVSPEEPGTRNTQLADSSTTETKCNMESVGSLGGANVHIKRKTESTDNLKVIISGPNVVPFSEEWLAAIESAGEEILTMKTGAVQHSPPDKSVPEPSPWSPVKRKNNQVIGPFDCTKHTNN